MMKAKSEGNVRASTIVSPKTLTGNARMGNKGVTKYVTSVSATFENADKTYGSIVGTEVVTDHILNQDEYFTLVAQLTESPMLTSGVVSTNLVHVCDMYYEEVGAGESDEGVR